MPTRLCKLGRQSKTENGLLGAEKSTTKIEHFAKNYCFFCPLCGIMEHFSSRFFNKQRGRPFVFRLAKLDFAHSYLPLASREFRFPLLLSSRTRTSFPGMLKDNKVQFTLRSLAKHQQNHCWGSSQEKTKIIITMKGGPTAIHPSPRLFGLLRLDLLVVEFQLLALQDVPITASALTWSRADPS